MPAKIYVSKCQIKLKMEDCLHIWAGVHLQNWEKKQSTRMFTQLFCVGRSFPIYTRLSIDELSQNVTYYISMANVLICFIRFQPCCFLMVVTQSLSSYSNFLVRPSTQILFPITYFLEEIPVWMLPETLQFLPLYIQPPSFSIHKILTYYILHLRSNHSTHSVIHYLGALDNVGEN